VPEFAIYSRKKGVIGRRLGPVFALAAGLGAVYIPHPRTWHLEHEQVPDPHHRLHILDRFTALHDLF